MKNLNFKNSPYFKSDTYQDTVVYVILLMMFFVLLISIMGLVYLVLKIFFHMKMFAGDPIIYDDKYEQITPVTQEDISKSKNITLTDLIKNNAYKENKELLKKYRNHRLRNMIKLTSADDKLINIAQDGTVDTSKFDRITDQEAAKKFTSKISLLSLDPANDKYSKSKTPLKESNVLENILDYRYYFNL